jgi:hypothetical protein
MYYSDAFGLLPRRGFARFILASGVRVALCELAYGNAETEPYG